MERGLYVWGMGIESKIKLNTLTKTESKTKMCTSRVDPWSRHEQSLVLTVGNGFVLGAVAVPSSSSGSVPAIDITSITF